MSVEWFADKVLDKVNVIVDDVSKEVAECVQADAKRLLKQKAKTTTERGLMDQFSVQKSKYRGGGWLVWSQGPGKWRKPYHASFVEMGTFKDEAKPFMRPAAKKNKRKAKKMFKDALK